jgi:hypothetical protein
MKCNRLSDHTRKFVCLTISLNLIFASIRSVVNGVEVKSYFLTSVHLVNPNYLILLSGLGSLPRNFCFTTFSALILSTTHCVFLHPEIDLKSSPDGADTNLFSV